MIRHPQYGIPRQLRYPKKAIVRKRKLRVRRIDLDTSGVFTALADVNFQLRQRSEPT